ESSTRSRREATPSFRRRWSTSLLVDQKRTVCCSPAAPVPPTTISSSSVLALCERTPHETPRSASSLRSLRLGAAPGRTIGKTGPTRRTHRRFTRSQRGGPHARSWPAPEGDAALPGRAKRNEGARSGRGSRIHDGVDRARRGARRGGLHAKRSALASVPQGFAGRALHPSR